MLNRKGLLAIVLVLALILPAAAALAATHLGVSPANLITLEFDGTNFKRVSRSGALATAVFIVPTAQNFVCLDVDWTFTVDGAVHNLTLQIDTTDHNVFATQGAEGKNVTLSAGFAVGPGVKIQATSDVLGSSTIILNGYLTANK
jgi:hypothetical protein